MIDWIKRFIVHFRIERGTTRLKFLQTNARTDEKKGRKCAKNESNFKKNYGHVLELEDCTYVQVEKCTYAEIPREI